MAARAVRDLGERFLGVLTLDHGWLVFVAAIAGIPGIAVWMASQTGDLTLANLCPVIQQKGVGA
jgi:hypothetical protein